MRLHFPHSATFLSLPFSIKVFIATSPPQGQKNLCVAVVVREFLLAPAILFLQNNFTFLVLQFYKKRAFLSIQEQKKILARAVLTISRKKRYIFQQIAKFSRIFKMDEEILTIEEVAKYLRVSERTVYDWAQKGEIPSGKIGTVWRFKKSEIEKWVNERLSSGSRLSTKKMAVQIKNILSADRIIFINQNSKELALSELSAALSKAPQVKNSRELEAEILKREELMSTAIGRGIAIPHARLSSVTDLVMAVGICKSPVTDYETIDDQPVRLLFMIAAAYNQREYYLQTLSKISACLKDTALRDGLLSAKDSREAYALLVE